MLITTHGFGTHILSVTLDVAIDVAEGPTLPFLKGPGAASIASALSFCVCHLMNPWKIVVLSESQILTAGETLP